MQFGELFISMRVQNNTYHWLLVYEKLVKHNKKKKKGQPSSKQINLVLKLYFTIYSQLSFCPKHQSRIHLTAKFRFARIWVQPNSLWQNLVHTFISQPHD